MKNFNFINRIKNAVLRFRMRHGVVQFKYTKKDGSVRTAHGTLKKSLLPPTLGTGRKPAAGVVVYYDTDKNSWRSFNPENLLTC